MTPLNVFSIVRAAKLITSYIKSDSVSEYLISNTSYI